MINVCPVCGYGLPFPPADNRICSCCGTEFGYDDLVRTPEVLRWNWIRKGARWFSRATPPPPRWDPVLQMILSGMGFAMHPSGDLVDENSVGDPLCAIRYKDAALS